jgi:polyhydroxyalkanoate synthesis repressor PhaR
MARLIKRYGNRKMYDPETSRYVTLDGIAELVRAGEDLRIIDNENGDDLTALTFAQIIFEEEKRKSGVLGLPVLRWIIQQGGATLQEILTSVDRGREALGNVRELAEKGVRQLVQGGDRRDAERPARRRLLNDILELPQKQIEQLQHRIDAQVRSSLERVTSHPTFQIELRRIERSIKNLERQLSRLHRSDSAPDPQRPARQRATKKGSAR